MTFEASDFGVDGHSMSVHQALSAIRKAKLSARYDDVVGAVVAPLGK